MKDIRLWINSTGDNDRDVVIECNYNYSGSGVGSFNNFEKWPHIGVSIALPAGREDIRDSLAIDLRDLIKEFISEHDLQKDQTIRTKENTRKEVWKEFGFSEEEK